MNATYGTFPFKMGLMLFSFLFFTFSLSAQLPSGFTDVKIQSGYIAPMGTVFSKNGQKMFVWEKSGKIWCSAWNGTAYVKPATPTLDISDEVGDWRDFGLQSVALDPNFDANGLIYLYYQVDRHYLFNFGTPQYSATTNEYFAASISRLTRYQLTTTNGVATADLASRKILLGETKSTGVPLLFESHAGGQIVFGADGTLLVTTGDNASFVSNDMGNDADTYWQQAINDGIMRATENVGAYRAQLINSFCGKLLRLDPNTGDGLSSNPFYDASTPRTAKSRTWALGFRNPYRMTFKGGTGTTDPVAGNPGTFIVGDVQNGSWEEFTMIEKGGVNCGWPLYEGIGPQYVFFNSGKTNPEEAGNPTYLSLCALGGRGNINNPVPSQRRFSHFAPALEWQHGQAGTRYVDYTQGNVEAPIAINAANSIVKGTPFKGNCVTAGTFYDKTAFPAQYQKVFFFGDYGANWIKAAVLHDNDSHQLHEVIDFAPEGYCKGLVDIETNPLDGSIVYVNISTGDIQRISYGATNRPPVAVIGSDKTTGTSPLTVNLTSTGSNDPDGDAITYNWDFGDGTSSTTANPTHTFTSPVSKGFTVTLTVTDSKGLTDIKTLLISTNNTAPSVKITNPTNNSLYTLAGVTQLTLKASITDNDTTGVKCAWQVTLRHNNHEHAEPIIDQKSPTVPISPVGCDGDTYYYLICVTATDNGGLTAKDSVKIYPDCNTGNPLPANLNAVAQINAVDLTWTNPIASFDEVMLVAHPSNSNTTLPNGTTYTANASFTGNGSALGGGKVVYRGTGKSVTVTNLQGKNKHYFRIFVRRGTIWTSGLEATATPNEPAATNLTATAQINATALTWTNPIVTFDEVMIVASSGGSNTTLPISSTTYTANASFTGNGSTLGSGKVLYRGTGTSVTVTNLTAATTYYFRIFIRKGSVWTSSLETTAIPIAAPPPSVTNLVATAQTNGAAVTWTNPTASYDELMVVARASSSNTTLPSSSTTYTANSSFTGNGTALGGGKVVYRGTGSNVTVTNLTAATTYYFRVYIRRGTVWTSSLETTAIPIAAPAPSVTNLIATAQTNAAAVTWTKPTASYDELMVVARASSSNNTLPSSSTTYTANSSFTGNGTALGGGKVVYRGTGANVTVTNLTAATTHYFRVYIRRGSVWTSSLETTTIPLAPIPPSVTNLIATAQTNAAAVTWTKPTASYDELMVVARASSSNNTLPNSGTTYTASSSFTGSGTALGGGKVVYLGSGSNVTVTNLTAATTYYFRVYIRKGTVWTSSLETIAIPTAVIPPSVTNLIATAQTNAAAITWTKPTASYDELMVVARASSSNNTLPSSSTTYTANSSFTGNGTALGGGKVVYRGTGSNVTVTNLTAATTYYFRVYIRKGTIWTSSLETTAIPTAVVVQLGCLKGSYFIGSNLSIAPTVVRAESSINYDWGAGSPTAGIPVDDFSVRWEGTVVPPSSGTYTFRTATNGALRLWVNNTLIIDKWISQSLTTYTANINLTKGQNVPIRFEYYEAAENASAQLQWTVPGASSQVMPFSACALPTFSATACYKLTARSNDKVLTVSNNSTSNGTQLQTSSLSTGSKTQLWRIKDLGDGTQRLVNTNSGKSADVLNGSTANNAAVVQWDWLNGNNQRWIVNKNTDGYYQLIAKHSGKAMEATGSNSNAVVQNTVSTSSAQQFRIETATCPAGAVASESANILAATGYRDAKKAVITWVSNANNNTDYFSVQRLDNKQPVFEKIQIVNAVSGAVGEKQSYTVSDIEPIYGENNIYRVALYRAGEDTPQYSELVAVDFSPFDNIVIFPNPADDYVDIDLETIRYRAVDISLMDVSGKIVQQKKITSAPLEPVRLDLQGLPTGTYFIHIESEGKREVVKKLMIAR